MKIKKLTAYNCCDYYSINEYGQVYNKNKKIGMSLDHNGYYQVRLNTRDNRRISVLVHRLVAFTFLECPENIYVGGYKKEGYTIDHIDGDKTNNHYSNLRWVPFYENIKLKTPFDNVNDDVALLIIKDLLDMYSIKEIQERRSVSKSMILRIRQGIRYKHLTKGISFPKTYAHRSRTELLTVIYYILTYPNVSSKNLEIIFKEKLNIKYTDSMIDFIRNNKSCQDYIKYIQNNNWKPSETIEIL